MHVKVSEMSPSLERSSEQTGPFPGGAHRVCRESQMDPTGPLGPVWREGRCPSSVQGVPAEPTPELGRGSQGASGSGRTALPQCLLLETFLCTAELSCGHIEEDHKPKSGWMI